MLCVYVNSQIYNGYTNSLLGRFLTVRLKFNFGFTMSTHAAMNSSKQSISSKPKTQWAIRMIEKRAEESSIRRKTLLNLCFLAFSPLAYAEPTGGVVSSGTGQITHSGNVTTIDQTSQNLAINWQTFNTSHQETVNFIQPSPSAIAVNRIADTNGTQFLGQLTAPGQVYLINPNGIVFGPGSQVNVGGLVASTLNINDSTLGANTQNFSGPGQGAIINQGTITAAPGGYVALIGNQVSNQGIITAQLGTVALAAGSSVTLSFNGADLVNIQVDQSTLNNLAENKQLIIADGGQVIMTAGAKDSLLASVINNTGVIQAQTVAEHNGVISLLGGMTAGTINVGGTLDASAPKTGAGGQIETSAAKVEVADNANVTTASAHGNSGTWLIDPTDYTIAAAGGNMSGQALSAALGQGKVEIASTSGTNGTQGNINVNDVVSWGSNKLTLNAQNNIYINANLNASGNASLALEYGQGPAPNNNTSNYYVATGVQVNLPAGQNFSTTQGLNGTPVNYTVIDSLATLQGINGSLTGNYALGASFDGSNSSNPSFTPLGTTTNPFSGVFDGLGHTINNLTISNPNSRFVGLFGYTSNTSQIQNIGLTNVNIQGNFFTGGLVGYSNGKVNNSYTTGSVTGKTDVGGLIGYNAGAVSNSYTTTAVNGSNFVGGLIGANSGAISASYTTGSTSGQNQVGGLIGDNFGQISNSYATGNVTGTDFVGGLIGQNSNSVINGAQIDASVTNTYATGKVTGTENIGQLIGEHVSGTVSNTVNNTTNPSPTPTIPTAIFFQQKPNYQIKAGVSQLDNQLGGSFNLVASETPIENPSENTGVASPPANLVPGNPTQDENLLKFQGEEHDDEI